MPRVIAFRLGPVWVAFTLNDYGQAGPRRFGLTREAAEWRAVEAA